MSIPSDVPGPRPVFLTPPRPPGEQTRLVTQAMNATSAAFPNWRLGQEFFSYTVLPASREWLYKPNGKSGTSSTLHFLFELEFGIPFTARLDSPADINPEQGIHNLSLTGVFRKLTEDPRTTDLLTDCDGLLTLTTVRHPASRALSGFFYLCTSHDRAHPMFSADRARMNAMVGFDWTRHPRTPEGFRRFLDYIRLSVQDGVQLPLNSHWRPQWQNVMPEILKPDLIGHTENLPGFFKKIAARLDRPLPPGGAITANRQPKYDSRPFLEDGTAKRLLLDCFSRDFDIFGYDPDDLAAPSAR